MPIVKVMIDEEVYKAIQASGLPENEGLRVEQFVNRLCILYFKRVKKGIEKIDYLLNPYNVDDPEGLDVRTAVRSEFEGLATREDLFKFRDDIINQLVELEWEKIQPAKADIKELQSKAKEHGMGIDALDNRVNVLEDGDE